MTSTTNEPIAIIGSACRFAGDATSPSKLWELLKTPRDVLSEIPASRFSAEGFHHHDGLYHGHSNVKHSYFTSEDPSAFDAEFFGIKPIEAKALDPQQRLLMEVAYEGLESAGMPIEKFRGSDTAVYVGQMCNDYEALLLRDLQYVPTYHGIGVGRSILSNRLSYFFDWHGPSMTLDTACSSSLIAVHLAAQALRAGDSRVALACGTNLLLGPENYITESKLKMLSPDGRSRMWDQDANGYARGDGVAVVVLKTLSAALADGDHIECIVRETGTNQDGTTKGITMPSASAQNSLIRSTYKKSGLDALKEEDRCQYFEAHGTGTPAGDPIEAEAIKRAFFGDESVSASVPRDPLYVGSIKTVLGHTEGTAGVAAILKASLALQHGVIPPNLLFNKLNPQIAPFYDNLEIATTAKAWPKLPDNTPRRASVNSFGFGGSNAHAILESFDESLDQNTLESSSSFAPFVFSASSEKSLVAILSAYAAFLATNSSINPSYLAQNLLLRRSLLSFRASFPAGSIDNLKTNIESRLSEPEESVGSKALSSSGTRPRRILGIFTGQGAQYARMGASLIETSQAAQDIIKELEGYLAQLPESDRPLWSLQKELLADPSSSRINDATLSQPLCTALQILLIRLLRLANVHLHGVVGHSSGEIGAAYAAGYLSARDALYIAYYRGLHCQLATGHGAMLAVGTSWEDAKGLCELSEFSKRVKVAASNSSTSVTISGDDDAIAELEDIFEDEGKFRRRLKVDKAYHSHHMEPCSQPYIESLRNSQIEVQSTSEDCTWFSSVYENTEEFDIRKLRDVYWAENMVQPVLFSQALSRALASGEFDQVIEIGSHPALKGPATQQIQDNLGQALPYSGTLSRGVDAVESFSSLLGSLWVAHGTSCVAPDKYEAALSGAAGFKVIKNLPTYQWNHETKYWHESRISRNLRLREHKVHSLLGDATPDSSPHHLSWKNLLKIKEIPWISGHQLQNQTVFPAAGYVAAALEASQLLANGNSVQLIEVEDFVIHQAMVFDEEDSGIETLVSLTDVDKSASDQIEARYTLAAGVGKEPRSLTLMASGRVRVTFGKATEAILPSRGPSAPHMVDVGTDLFYSSLSKIGYNYSGAFKALSSLTRKLGRASGVVDLAASEDIEERFLVHPAMLDCALQSVILAFSYPNDGELWSLHVPTGFSRIRVNPLLCGSKWDDKASVPFESVSTDRDTAGFTGDVDLYDSESNHVAIQVEGMRAVPFASPTAADDKKIFSNTIWKVEAPNAENVAHDDEVKPDEHDLAYVCERISTFYTREFSREFPLDHVASSGPFSRYLNWVRHINTLQETGKHVYAKKEWLNDTLEEILQLSER